MTRRDPVLGGLVTQEKTQSLLELLGINILEQALLGVEDSARSVMRRKLAELTKALQDPTEIDALVTQLEIKRQVASHWAVNQHLGRKVEELVKAVLDVSLRTEVHFRGYDLDAYLKMSALPEEDVGCLEVGVAKIEIKATRSGSISMSNIQADTSAAEPRRFWLCVVSLESDQSLSSLDTDYVRARARFVPSIGDILSKPLGELSDAVKVARVAGVELQHVEEIRYKIGRAIWESQGTDVEGFVQRLIQSAREGATKQHEAAS